MASSAVSGGRGMSIPIAFVVLAVLAALAVGAVGGYLVKAASVPAATVAGQMVAGQPAASGPGSAWNYSTRRSGTQSVEGPAPNSPAAASFRTPAAGRSGPQS